jgi:hypothetical protein
MMMTAQAPAESIVPAVPRPRPANKIGDLGIIRIDEVALTHQRVLDLCPPA